MVISEAAGGLAFNARYNNLLRMLRLPRLYRLLKTLRLVKILKIVKNNMQLNKFFNKINLSLGFFQMLKLIILVIFITHFVSCLWFLAAKLQSFEPDTWVYRKGLLDESLTTQYIASYYWAFQTLTTVGYGDIAPQTTVEMIISICWMLTGVGVYSFTIGNLSTILSNIDKRASILKVSSIVHLKKSTLNHYYLYQ